MSVSTTADELTEILRVIPAMGSADIDRIRGLVEERVAAYGSDSATAAILRQIACRDGLVERLRDVFADLRPEDDDDFAEFADCFLALAGAHAELDLAVDSFGDAFELATAALMISRARTEGGDGP